MAVFDSDDAGTEARQALQGFFTQKKIGYDSGKDFISIRRGYAIEGLFSDRIIEDIHLENSKVIAGFSKDSQGTVEPFRINDNWKQDAFKLLTARAERENGFEWAIRFISVCAAIESALSHQQARLKKITL